MAGRDFLPTKSADRVCQLLNLLAARGPMTHADLAQHLAIPKSSLTPLLATLEAQRFVQRDSTGRHYTLGAQIFSLAQRYLATLDLARIGQPVVDRIMREIGESTALSIASGGEIVVVAKANCSQPLQRTMQLGERAPMYATAAGKAMLAFRPVADVERLFADGKLAPVTPHSIRSRRLLLKELDGVRACGLAYSRAELLEGIIAVGVPVFGADGTPAAALSVAVPAVRCTPKHESGIADALRSAAAALSQELGHAGPAVRLVG